MSNATIKAAARARGGTSNATCASTSKPAEPLPESELAMAFKRLGHSESSAKVAARGRSGPASAGSLVEAGKRLGLPQAAAKTFARGRDGVTEAVTRHEPGAGNFKGGDFPASDYAYVGDREDPNTWKLRLTVTPGGPADRVAVRAAVAAVDPANLAVPNPEIPDDDMPAVLARLHKAWTQAGLSADEMPSFLAAEALRRAFRQLGLSEREAAIAAKGRS